MAAACVAVAIVHPALAVADPLSISALGQLALHCGPSVAPSTLASVARAESGFEPLSINDNTAGTSVVPGRLDAAIRIASRLLTAGHSVDIGLMQINSGNFPLLGLTIETAFDPCRSIAAAAAILVGDYAGGSTHAEQQSALRVALSRYNTGDAQRGFANGYVHKVKLAARRIVPALDADEPGATTDERSAPVSAAATRVDPDAPPSWDVWPSYDYAAAHPQGDPSPAGTSPPAARAVLTQAGKGPPVPATIPGPTAER